MKKKIALALAGIMMVAGLSACGKEEGMSTPSTSEPTTEATTEDETTEDETTEAETTEDDTEEDGTASGKTASVGYFDGNVYYNDFVNFKLEVDGSAWVFYDAAEMASITGIEESEIEALRSGEVSPYDVEMAYCALAYDSTTGTNIIINYFNPAKYGMDSISAKDYLSMAAASYEGAVVTETEYLGRTYAVLNLPQEESASYSQSMYATEQDGLIVMITFTVMTDENADEIAAKLTAM